MGLNPWIRFYREALHDPKIVTLTDRQHRVWTNALLIADDTGRLPSMRDIAAHLRMCIPDAEQAVIDLVEAGLIDAEVQRDGSRSYGMHGWAKRQYVSDSSTERSRKFRAKNARNGDATLQQRSSNVAVTPPDPDPDSETDLNLLPYEQDATRGSEVKFKFDLGGIGLGSGVTKPISPEALRRAAQRANVADASPLLDAFDAWPVSRKARDREALFVSSAAKLLANSPDDVRRRCAPIEDEIKPKPVKPSRELVAALQRGGRHGR